jgi:hydrogenase maturation protein HypF
MDCLLEKVKDKQAVVKQLQLNSMTWHIHIKGQVQGVGFRPFVYLTAKKHDLKGWVNNAYDGVHIEFNANKNLALAFRDEITANAPDLSRITAIHLAEVQQKSFDNFQIIYSQSVGDTNLLITPDFALCSSCRLELYDTKDRRKGYPFITCINCGPRFSIIEQLPYDREHTTMDAFEMCPSCSKEYENPSNRRYYAQTNSCPDCGIKLSLYDTNRKEIASKTEEVMESIVQYWEQGKIVAIKGIGGYLLTCDATNKAAINTLRKRKHRPSKPFALMYPNADTLNKFYLTDRIRHELESPVSPIVLLNTTKPTSTSNEISPGLNQHGVMLPYTPLYEMLLNKFGQPIIATSGNISNSPIVFQDKKAVKELAKIADLIVVNNREIVIPQDDSVVKYTPWKEQRILLRRSRGLAPTYINKELDDSGKSVLSMGAMLKSTFCLMHKHNCYVSQYLGDLEEFDSQQNYQAVIDHFLKLFNVQPDFILCDKHLNYPSTQYGYELSNSFKVPVHAIQHHLAHFGAILGEHNLVHTPSPVLGIIWDGTGLGNDGQIWGGEFFKYEQYDFLRCYHFDYFDFILGDKMPKEPRLSALSAGWDVIGVEELLKDKFTPTEWRIYSKLLNKDNPLKTSSVGRIFDAVASVLGILDQQTYEGEAAMRLEAIATLYFKKYGLDFKESYFLPGEYSYRIPTKSLITNIMMDLRKGIATDFIAAKFHFSLVQLIKIVANKLKISRLAFSGGVFQNGLLVDLIQHHLDTHFELFFHQELAPNDENISFGQQICFQIENIKNK